MRAIFMGTGTSLGVPIIGCDCPGCRSKDPRDKRTRSSIFLEFQDKNIVIDTGPDFRSQCLVNGISRIDAILITHPHRDHLAGLDDIRPFCYKQLTSIPIYGSQLSCEAIRRDFDYCFGDNKYPGVPEITLHELDESYQPFMFCNICIQPIPVMHGNMIVTAYRFGDFTYITDANMISAESMEKIRGTKYLVINALSNRHHHSHFSLYEALDVIKELSPQKAYITHIGHSLIHSACESLLPRNVCFAYDGLTINI